MSCSPTWATADKNEDEESYKENVFILIADATQPELNDDTLFRLEYPLRRSPVSRIIIAVNKMDIVVESIDSDHADVSANAHKDASVHGNADISTSGDAPPSHARIATRRRIPPNAYWRDPPRFGLNHDSKRQLRSSGVKFVKSNPSTRVTKADQWN
ncbi:hypothetical protein LIPSTDRAFT_1170 [Lipomyces starkeyi NRRL Y-11557]|uniref:Uncharacterized protein n=1 Tax=Lipomyces starkeyi NRRL Y-11557 TaxID=675824 RepID=A0A1E3QDH6_LIPST|nr:hypothetical protein LIPSTDRAFT_1170 [Lipomyces starkeyi NRRL Y-11557]